MKLKSLKIAPKSNNDYLNGVRIKIDGKTHVPAGAPPELWKVEDLVTTHRDEVTIDIVTAGQPKARATVELDIEDRLQLKGELSLEGGLEKLTLKVGDF